MPQNNEQNKQRFALVCTPVLIRHATFALERQFRPLKIGRQQRLPAVFYLINLAVLILLLAETGAYTAITLSPANLSKIEADTYPVVVVQFMRHNNPAGPLFNSYNIGGYLHYHLWPDYPVFVDGRTDLYNDAFLRTYLRRVNTLPG